MPPTATGENNVNLAHCRALKGTDPNDNRIFIISGHLDSRRTDVLTANEAPGANDDGSGSAAVITCVS